MSEFMAGGRRRVDRVLAPDFLTGVSELSLDEVRARRADAEQEEVDLSYARRLLQGRLDILRAEQEVRRSSGGVVRVPRTDLEIVGELSRILADAIDHLGDIEVRISRTRRSVQVVFDSLTEEIARRYASGEIEVVLR